MSYTITDNTNTIENNLTVKTNSFLRLFAEAVVNTAEPNTPKKKGNLSRDVLKEVLGLKARIVWNKNYAIYQEKKQYKNYTTPGTGPHFAQNAVGKMVKETSSIAKRAGLI